MIILAIIGNLDSSDWPY